MTTHYTDEKNVQIVISLLKQYGIRKVIASPGATNITFVASIQQDPWFEIYSSVDERSAAYMACGLAAESGEPVVINCTGATSSRNYMPALTEAYYRKLPIITITSSQILSKKGHLIAQVTDRSSPPSDVVKCSVNIQYVKDEDDIWDCEIKVNKALLEINRNGGGPVHLNLETIYSQNYDVMELPKYRKIERITFVDKFPELPKGKIAIFIGSHATMSNEQIAAIDNFCASNNAVAFCDHTSSYRGPYAINYALLGGQIKMDRSIFKPDILIHIGEISGNYYTAGVSGKCVWRVNLDGEIRDTFKRLQCVFEMPIERFFNYYSSTSKSDGSYYKLCLSELNTIRTKLPDVPFSNIWIASKLSPLLPDNSTLHLGILNSLRAWNFFDLPQSVRSMSNVGGFGIDGCISSLVGASLCHPDKLYYLVLGDLAFLYDMNVVANRHVRNNIRILLVNNGKGTEFRNHGHNGAKFGDDADVFIAAGGHFGNKSSKLVKGYAESLGYEYISASTKEEFNSVYERFLTPIITDQPMIFEVFTNSEDESNALKMIVNIGTCTSNTVKDTIKNAVKGIIGKGGVEVLRKIVKNKAYEESRNINFLYNT